VADVIKNYPAALIQLIAEGFSMRLKQSDIFQGLNPNILKAIMAIGTRHAFPEGTFVYHRDDPADFIYILMQGEVRLHLGDDGTEVFVIAGLGEVFGWSSLIGRKRHMLSAFCGRPSTVLKMDQRRLTALIEADPDSSIVFYRQLSRALGNRLLQIYDTVAECGEPDEPPQRGD
jgi:CRP-like cAMP-binding protein